MSINIPALEGEYHISRLQFVRLSLLSISHTEAVSMLPFSSGATMKGAAHLGCHPRCSPVQGGKFSLCFHFLVVLQGWAPLHSAVSAGHDDIVSRLLSLEADVKLRTSGGQTALHYAVCTLHPVVQGRVADTISGGMARC